MGIKNVEDLIILARWENLKFIKMKNTQITFSRKKVHNSSDQITTEAAIYSTILGDLYIAIGDKNSTNDNESWTTRIWFNPFTIWIWIGVFLLSLGGLTSLIKTLRKKE